MKLTEEYIKSICYSTRTFEKGSEYYYAGRVKKIVAVGNTVCAEVQGTYLYDVELTFDANGLIFDHDCNCLAHSSYPGICKHIVAVLFKLMLEHTTTKQKKNLKSLRL